MCYLGCAMITWKMMKGSHSDPHFKMALRDETTSTTTTLIVTYINLHDTK